MDEITLDMAPEVLDAWRSDPATEKVLEFLTKIRDSYRMSPVDMPTQSYSAERIALELCRIQGRVEGIEEILNLKGGFTSES